MAFAIFGGTSLLVAYYLNAKPADQYLVVTTAGPRAWVGWDSKQGFGLRFYCEIAQDSRLALVAEVDGVETAQFEGMAVQVGQRRKAVQWVGAFSGDTKSLDWIPDDTQEHKRFVRIQTKEELQFDINGHIDVYRFTAPDGRNCRLYLARVANPG